MFVYSPLVWMPLSASVIAVALLVYSRRFASLPEIRYFRLLAALTAVWALMVSLDLCLTGLDEKLLLLKLKFLVTPFTCVAVFGLLASHSGKEAWLTKRNLALLTSVPLATGALVLTMEAHQLLLFGFSIRPSGSIYILECSTGPWFWFYITYAYAIMAAGVVLLVASARGGHHLYKRQAAVLLFAVLVPLLFDVLDNYAVIQTAGEELAPPSFAVSGIIMAWGLHRYRILDVRPVARGEVVENMTDVLLVIDTENRLIDYNRAAIDLLVRSPGSKVGAPLSDAVPFGRDIEALLSRGTGRAEVSVGEGPGRRTFEASVMPVEVKGELRARMVLLRDITERKRVEEALHAANARLGLLTSMTRHDLLNKLTVIDGYVTLARQEKDPERAKAFLSKLGLASDAARSLMTFTKDYESVGIRAPSWHAVEDLFHRAAGQLTIERVAVSTDTRGLSVYADAMLEKAFYNLLDNTLRHGGAVSTISLTCEEGDDGLVLAYQDDGVGIPADDKDYIFERGFGKNTGLGLFLTKEVLAITGITVRETGEPGKGARFELLVPRGAYRFEPMAGFSRLTDHSAPPLGENVEGAPGPTGRA